MNIDVRIPSRKVENNEIVSLESVFTQLDEMLKAFGMMGKPGIGLAGCQVGLDLAVAIVRMGEFKLNLWNPEILSYEKPLIIHTEGCLSFPEIRTVTRYNAITLKNGDGKIYSLEGSEAVVVQHEVDHILGKTIFDRIVEKPGRNALCPCDSGKKYKKCCL